jgi:hypothetical protein
MSTERVSFEAKLLAPPPHEAQLVRDDPEDAYERSVREAMRREALGERGPKWAFDDFPFPFACFWTCLLTLAIGYPAHSLLVSLAMLAMGLWMGVKLDRWLRNHPSTGGRRLRSILGVD